MLSALGSSINIAQKHCLHRIAAIYRARAPRGTRAPRPRPSLGQLSFGPLEKF